MTKYLLPCTCGKKTPVEPRQAGEEIACRCGKRLEIPTMRAISALEVAPSNDDSLHPTRTWGAAQAMMVLGVVLLAAATGLMIVLSLYRPSEPKPELIRKNAQLLTPAESLSAWEYLQESGLDVGESPDVRNLDKQFVRYYISNGACAVLALIGLTLIVVSWRTTKQSQAGRALPR